MREAGSPVAISRIRPRHSRADRPRISVPAAHTERGILLRYCQAISVSPASASVATAWPDDDLPRFACHAVTIPALSALSNVPDGVSGLTQLRVGGIERSLGGIQLVAPGVIAAWEMIAWQRTLARSRLSSPHHGGCARCPLLWLRSRRASGRSRRAARSPGPPRCIAHVDGAGYVCRHAKPSAFDPRPYDPGVAEGAPWRRCCNDRDFHGPHGLILDSSLALAARRQRCDAHNHQPASEAPPSRYSRVDAHEHLLSQPLIIELA